MTTASIQPGAMNGALGGFPPDPGSKPAAVLAVLVHVAFFSILVFGLRWNTKAPDAVVVEIWSTPAVEPRVEPPPPAPKIEPKVEPKPLPKVETKPLPKVEPKVEPRVVRKPDIAVEKEKPKPVKKFKMDQSKAINDELQRELQKVSVDREKAAKAAPPPPPAGPVDAAYGNRIRSRIYGNIVIPQDVVGNPESTFEVIQLPTGEVLSVQLRKSSGNKALDDAWERAIRKSSPLPRPDRPDQFQRQLNLTFRPKD
jgi:colicin import membrane protein